MVANNNNSGPTAAPLKPQNTGDSIRSERSFHSSHGHQTPVLSRKSSIANTKINTAQIGVPLPKNGDNAGGAGENDGAQPRPRMHKRSLTGEYPFALCLWDRRWPNSRTDRDASCFAAFAGHYEPTGAGAGPETKWPIGDEKVSVSASRGSVVGQMTD